MGRCGVNLGVKEVRGQLGGLVLTWGRSGGGPQSGGILGSTWYRTGIDSGSNLGAICRQSGVNLRSMWRPSRVDLRSIWGASSGWSRVNPGATLASIWGRSWSLFGGDLGAIRGRSAVDLGRRQGSCRQPFRLRGQSVPDAPSPVRASAPRRTYMAAVALRSAARALAARPLPAASARVAARAFAIGTYVRDKPHMNIGTIGHVDHGATRGVGPRGATAGGAEMRKANRSICVAEAPFP